MSNEARQKIVGQALIPWLIEQGIILPGEPPPTVIIDAYFDQPVEITLVTRSGCRTMTSGPDYLGTRFMDWLEEQGVIPSGRPLLRASIFAHVDAAVKICLTEHFTQPAAGLGPLHADLVASLQLLSPEEPA